MPRGILCYVPAGLARQSGPQNCDEKRVHALRSEVLAALRCSRLSLGFLVPPIPPRCPATSCRPPLVPPQRHRCAVPSHHCCPIVVHHCCPTVVHATVSAPVRFPSPFSAPPPAPVPAPLECVLNTLFGIRTCSRCLITRPTPMQVCFYGRTAGVGERGRAGRRHDGPGAPDEPAVARRRRAPNWLVSGCVVGQRRSGRPAHVRPPPQLLTGHPPRVAH